MLCVVDMMSYLLARWSQAASRSHSSTVSFLPVSCPSKSGYLASTSAQVILPLARSRTTLGSSETWEEKRSASISQLDTCDEHVPWIQEPLHAVQSKPLSVYDILHTMYTHMMTSFTSWVCFPNYAHPLPGWLGSLLKSTKAQAYQLPAQLSTATSLSSQPVSHGCYI